MRKAQNEGGDTARSLKPGREHGMDKYGTTEKTQETTPLVHMGVAYLKPYLCEVIPDTLMVSKLRRVARNVLDIL